MPKSKHIIDRASALSHFIAELRELQKEYGYLTVTVDTAKDRSLEQNRLFHAWCNQVSQERGEMTPTDVKTHAKAWFGIPILLAEDDEFREAYNASVLLIGDVESKMKAISLLPVTSRMKTKQLSEMMDKMREHYAGLVVDPVYLECEE